MADLIKKIRTAKGDLQIDYTALANLPTISYTVDENGVLRTELKSIGTATFDNTNIIETFSFVVGWTWKDYINGPNEIQVYEREDDGLVCWDSEAIVKEASTGNQVHVNDMIIPGEQYHCYG